VMAVQAYRLMRGYSMKPAVVWLLVRNNQNTPESLSRCVRNTYFILTTYPVGARASLLAVKWPTREADRSVPPSVEAKNVPCKAQ
jgi:hypothetical protein